MKYNRKMLGEVLSKELELGYDVTRISRRFFDIYLNDEIEDDSLTKEIFSYLYLMEADPQFEYSKEELVKICQLLTNDQSDELKNFIKR